MEARRAKLNVFDARDTDAIRVERVKEAHSRGEDALAAFPLTEVTSGAATFKNNGTKSQELAVYQKPKPVDYLIKGREARETIKDFVSRTRRIFMSGLQIVAKNEESERLQEYINMEQDKVKQAQRYLKEQREECEKMMFEHQNHHKSCQDVVRKAVQAKGKLIKEAEELEHKIAAKETEIKRLNDDLVTFKSHKRFLDILAIQAGLKPYTPKMILHSNESSTRLAENASTAHQTGAMATQQKGGGDTFLTTVGSPPSRSGASKLADTQKSWGKGNKPGKKEPHAAAKTPTAAQQNTNQTSATFNAMTPGAPGLSSADGEKDAEAALASIRDEIDLEHSQYEDDVFKVFFPGKRQLLAYSGALEDDNLFKITLVQEAEMNLERMKQRTGKQQERLQEQVDTVTKNIENFQQSLRAAESRHNYFSQIQKKDGGSTHRESYASMHTSEHLATEETDRDGASTAGPMKQKQKQMNQRLRALIKQADPAAPMKLVDQLFKTTGETLRLLE